MRRMGARLIISTPNVCSVIGRAAAMDSDAARQSSQLWGTLDLRLNCVVAFATLLFRATYPREALRAARAALFTRRSRGLIAPATRARGARSVLLSCLVIARNAILATLLSTCSRRRFGASVIVSFNEKESQPIAERSGLRPSTRNVR